MPKFGKTSIDRLDTCDPRLQHIFLTVIEKYDCSIICGHRNKEEQDLAFKEGKSKLKWPKGKHNTLPSKAVDVAPFINGKISWNSAQCYHFAGYVLRVAQELGIKIRWGGDWDSDKDLSDNKFDDLVHFELVD